MAALPVRTGHTDVHVSSKNRALPTTATSTAFMVRLAQPVGNVVGASLIEAIIPKTFYNVTSSNNRLDFNDGAVKSLTITSGSYDATTLCSAIQTAFNAASTNWTVSVSLVTFAITIARSAGTNTLLFATGANVSSSIASTLGFAATDCIGSASYTGTMCINLTRPLSLFIAVAEIPGVSVTTSVLANYSFKVPMGGSSSGDIVTYSRRGEYVDCIPVSKQSFAAFNIKLCDDTGTPINLNGADWECVIRCHTG